MKIKNIAMTLVAAFLLLFASEKAVAAIEVTNPLEESIEVVPVGLYGVSTDDTTGEAYLVLRVTLHNPKESAAFGSSIKNKKMMAVDAAGNIYHIDASGAMRYDLPEDVPVLVKIEEPQMRFTGLSKELTVMPVVKFGINIDAYHQDNLTLRNVPIYWDEYPE